MSKQCAELMPDGTQCKAYEAKGTGYCAGHARKRGLLEIQKKPAKVQIEVGEPGPLAALRASLDSGLQLDPRDAVELANLLRPYLGLAPLDSVQVAKQIDLRQQADEQIAARELAQQNLLNKSLALIEENPDPEMVRRIEAKVARDLERATENFRTTADRTRAALALEPKVQVFGTGEDELYSVNGVRLVIPAEGVFNVPATFAQLHHERRKAYRELAARSKLMESTPEYTEVYRGMASIDSTFNSRSQLGGGPQIEQSDYMVAEEIK